MNLEQVFSFLNDFNYGKILILISPIIFGAFVFGFWQAFVYIFTRVKMIEKVLDVMTNIANKIALNKFYPQLEKIKDIKAKKIFIKLICTLSDSFDYGLTKGIKGIRVKKFDKKWNKT